MKIALIGATGFVGSAILQEASSRGHEVTAIQRNPEKITKDRMVKVVTADIMNSENLGLLLSGHDVVISAYNPGWDNPKIYEDYLAGTRSIMQALTLAKVKRFITIGGAGSLYIAPGKQLVDSPEFPEQWKQGALAARDFYELIKQNDRLEWTFVSPAIELMHGKKTGNFRSAEDSPVMDAEGRSRISVEDLAVAVIDEAENPVYIRKRFTVGY